MNRFANIWHDYIINEINVDSDDIVGLIERISIDGLGEVDAKIDSGNGAYNVLHGSVEPLDCANRLVVLGCAGR